MTPYGFLMECLKNLSKKPRGLEVLKIAFDLRSKDEHLGWVFLDTIHISKRMVFLLKVYLLSLRLGKFLVKLRLKAKGLHVILLRFLENLFGALAQVCEILTLGLLLPLYLIVSLVGMCHLVSNHGQQTFLQNNRQREHLLGKTRHWKKSWKA